MSDQVHGVLDRVRLVDNLVRDEGLRLKPYLDTVNKITIGIGRNLTDVGITRDEAFTLVNHDIDRVVAELKVALPWLPAMDEVRVRVLVNMGFNLGVPKLLLFKNTLQAIADGDWQKAHDGMLGSLWAQQVGNRAKRLAEMMRTGHE